MVMKISVIIKKRGLLFFEVLKLAREEVHDFQTTYAKVLHGCKTER